MTDDIRPEIHARIDALLREITSVHLLENDTRDELQAHMVEKFLDYKQGVEPVTDDDAFVLMREHFGKPEVIRAMYHDTPRRFAPALFIRWFGAAALALIMVTEVERWLTLFVKWVVRSSWSGMQNPSLLAYNAMYMFDLELDVMMILVGAVVLFLVLRSWRKVEEQGRLMWYQRMPLWLMIALTAGVLGLAVMFGQYGVHAIQYGIPSGGMAHSLLHRFHGGAGLGFGVYPVIVSARLVIEFTPLIVIFWWFDRKPRPVNLAVFLLTVIILSPVIQLINQAIHYSWSMSIFGRYFSRTFLLSLQDTLPSVLCLFAIYLLGSGYSALRNRVIAAVKPVKAFND